MNQDILSAQADNEAPRILVQGTRYPDVVVANHGSDDVGMMFGDFSDGSLFGGGLFGVGANPSSVALGDLNGDGALDLVTANEGSNDVSVLSGDGLGDFTATVAPVSVGTAPSAVALGDINHDGRLDIITANAGSDQSNPELEGRVLICF